MSSLANSLQQQFPTKNIQPYGKVLVIPSKLYKNEWENQLRGEGYKTHGQSFNGELCVFVGLEQSVAIEKVNSKFKKRWTETESSMLKELFSQELSYAEIGEKLGRTKGSIMDKVQRLKLVRYEKPEPTNMLEPTVSITDNVVKEYLACVSELYPRYRHVCAFILKEASNKVLGEK